MVYRKPTSWRHPVHPTWLVALCDQWDDFCVSSYSFRPPAVVRNPPDQCSHIIKSCPSTSYIFIWFRATSLVRYAPIRSVNGLDTMKRHPVLQFILKINSTGERRNTREIWKFLAYGIPVWNLHRLVCFDRTLWNTRGSTRISATASIPWTALITWMLERSLGRWEMVEDASCCGNLTAISSYWCVFLILEIDACRVRI